MKAGISNEVLIPKVLWVLYFCFTTISALIFQKLLLPLVPSLHAGYGLLTNDAIHFHTLAVGLVEQIHAVGWSAWSIWPHYSGGANVSILAILYYFFGPDPSLVIPINAVLHATGGVCIYLIAKAIVPGGVGHYAGLVVSTIFVMFPSGLMWYAQLHKDGYAILGLLFVVYSWVQWAANGYCKNRIIYFLGGNIIGGILLLSVRSYALDILLLAVLLMFILVLINTLIKKKKLFLPIIGSASAVLCIGLLVSAVHVFNLGNDIDSYYSSERNEKFEEHCSKFKSWEWQSSNWAPKLVDHYASAFAGVRYRAICYAPDAYSTLDRNIFPSDIGGVITYLPRALQIAMFAPFPDAWFHDISMTRIVGWAEIFVWYLFVPGLIILLLKRNTLPVWLVLSFGIVFLLAYSYVAPNLGTLHRLRYPFIMVFMLLGALGWCDLFSKRISLMAFSKTMKPSYLVLQEGFVPGGARLIQAGISVVVLTALSFVLFFCRDVLMGQKFGVGGELDAFFLAMLLPMFIVNVFSVPLGSALVPIYCKLRKGKENDADSMLSIVLFFSLACLILVGSMLLIFGNIIYPTIVSGLEVSAIIRTLDLLPYSVLILILSAAVVIGNAALNSRKTYSWPALFQVVVPAFAIIFLFIYGKELGIASVAIGMLVGQIINLILVLHLLYRDGFILKLNFSTRFRKESYGELWKIYVALAVAALFVSAATVIDNIMASELNAGSIGIYSLGSKVSIFVTGIIGAGLTSVVLPRFSSLFSKGAIEECRHDLAFFIYMGTALTIPVALVLFAYCDDVVRVIFAGDMMSMESAKEVGDVAIFGVIQLPFFVTYALLIRFANANQKGKLVVFAAAVGLILNIVLNIILIRTIGIAGLALATSLSMLVTGYLLLMVSAKLAYLRALDVLLITLFWGLYLTAVMSMYFRSYAGVAVSIIAIALLIREIWGNQRIKSLKMVLSAS